MNTRSIDSIKLISLIKERKPIYSGSNKLLKNKEQIQALWQEVATILDVSVTAARCKWQNLRSNFCREKRKLTEGQKKKSWWPYFELMSFVDNHSKNKTRQVHNSDSSGTESDVIVIEDEEELTKDSDEENNDNSESSSLFSNSDDCLPVIKSSTSLLGKRKWSGLLQLKPNGILFPLIVTPTKIVKKLETSTENSNKIDTLPSCSNLPDETNLSDNNLSLSNSATVKVINIKDKITLNSTNDISSRKTKTLITHSSESSPLFYDEIDSEGSDDDNENNCELVIDETRSSGSDQTDKLNNNNNENPNNFPNSNSGNKSISVLNDELIDKKNHLDKTDQNNLLKINSSIQDQNKSEESDEDASNSKSTKQINQIEEENDQDMFDEIQKNHHDENKKSNKLIKSKRKDVKNLERYHQSNWSFLRSLLHSMDELPLQLNIKFKSEVFELLSQKLLEKSLIPHDE